MAGSVHPDGFDVALRFALPQDVAVSMVLTVEAAAIRIGLDVAASLMPAVAAAAIGERKGFAASVADCCGSGFSTWSRRCGVPDACCCGSGAMVHHPFPDKNIQKTVEVPQVQFFDKDTVHIHVVLHDNCL